MWWAFVIVAVVVVLAFFEWHPVSDSRVAHREESVAMNNLKRFSICLAGHKWGKVAYPRSPEGEATGTFLRCLRCGKENHDAGTVARGTGTIL